MMSALILSLICGSVAGAGVGLVMEPLTQNLENGHYYWIRNARLGCDVSLGPNNEDVSLTTTCTGVSIFDRYGDDENLFKASCNGRWCTLSQSPWKHLKGNKYAAKDWQVFWAIDDHDGKAEWQSEHTECIEKYNTQFCRLRNNNKDGECLKATANFKLVMKKCPGLVDDTTGHDLNGYFVFVDSGSNGAALAEGVNVLPKGLNQFKGGSPVLLGAVVIVLLFGQCILFAYNVYVCRSAKRY